MLMMISHVLIKPVLRENSQSICVLINFKLIVRFLIAYIIKIVLKFVFFSVSEYKMRSRGNTIQFNRKKNWCLWPTDTRSQKSRCLENSFKIYKTRKNILIVFLFECDWNDFITMQHICLEVTRKHHKSEIKNIEKLVSLSCRFFWVLIVLELFWKERF